MNKVKCKYCGKEYSKKGIGTHIWRSHGNGINFDPNRRIKSGEIVQWNKGKKFEDLFSVEKSIEIRRKNSKGGKAWKGKHHSEETKKKLSIYAKQHNFGGYTKGGGRGKHGWYKNIWCDSSWELAWVIYHLDHNIFFKRNTKRFYYTFNDKQHYYTPDFKIGDKFIEIKGWLDEKNKEKIKQFPNDLKLEILFEKDLLPIFEYVENIYGKDWIKLYEKN